MKSTNVLIELGEFVITIFKPKDKSRNKWQLESKKLHFDLFDIVVK